MYIHIYRVVTEAWQTKRIRETSVKVPWVFMMEEALWAARFRRHQTPVHPPLGAWRGTGAARKGDALSRFPWHLA
jgi:hypothetical protein